MDLNAVQCSRHMHNIHSNHDHCSASVFGEWTFVECPFGKKHVVPQSIQLQIPAATDKWSVPFRKINNIKFSEDEKTIQYLSILISIFDNYLDKFDK